MSGRHIPFWPIVFSAVFIFQVSILPDTLGMSLLSRVVNTLALTGFVACSISVLAGRMPERVFVLYCFPVTLIFLGYLGNILRSTSLDALSYLGMLLPWAAALAVPFTRGFDSDYYWRLFYRFMLVASIISLAEYAAVFEGVLGTRVIHTSRGEFLKGVFTIFQGHQDNTASYRMFGVFAEPGTFAMYLLLALAYCLVYRRVLAAIVFLSCMALTFSLGGYIGLVLLMLAFVYWEARRRGAAAALLIWSGVAIVLAVVGGSLYAFFAESYENKGVSAFVREENVTSFFRHFFEIIFQDPLGMELRGGSLTELADFDRLYIGSNFSLGTALTVGGLASFLGYAMFLLVNTWCWLRATMRQAQSPSKTVACVCISFPVMLTFIVQRATLFDSALYSFLFAAPLLALLRRDSPEDRPDLTSLAGSASD